MFANAIFFYNIFALSGHGLKEKEYKELNSRCADISFTYPGNWNKSR